MKAVQGKKKNKAANFVIQGSILAMAGILVRIIGMLYRMPLNDIIGKQGKALKKVATEARRDLERFFGKTVFLETYVKVDKDWRSSDKELRNFGYQLD